MKLLDEMTRIFNQRVKLYRDDIKHDILRVKQILSSPEVHPVNRNRAIFWSVGETGSMIGLCDGPDDRPWVYPNSVWENYDHYRITIRNGRGVLMKLNNNGDER